MLAPVSGDQALAWLLCSGTLQSMMLVTNGKSFTAMGCSVEIK